MTEPGQPTPSTLGPASALPIQPGTTVNGKYVIENILGEGGMGVVVAARHLTLDQRVAIKFLLPSAQAMEGVTERFANEAKASARLKSEHVARILDVDRLPDGTPFMVMEYLEGTDLAGVLRERGRIPVEEACGYVLQACEALAEAHAKGIIHRDLKPGNLFVARGADGGEVVKLLDFGISKTQVPEGESFSLTRTSAVLGSPLYMPPEQMSSARTVDARADLWSLGVVLYEAVTGAPPFDGLSLTALVANIIQEEPRPMSASGATLPPGFEALVLRCLEKSPARRMASVGELAQGLARFAAASGEGLERISRLEARNPSIRPSMAPTSGARRSEPAPAPARLVRIQRVEPPPTSAAAPNTTPSPVFDAAAITHTSAVSTVDAGAAQRPHASEGGRPARRALAFGALVVVAAAATGVALRGGRGTVPDASSAGKAESPLPTTTSTGELPPSASIPPRPTPRVTATPPATFTPEPTAAPSSHAARTTVARPVAAPVDRTAPAQVPTPTTPAARVVPPSAPSPSPAAPPRTTIDMEPK